VTEADRRPPGGDEIDFADEMKALVLGGTFGHDVDDAEHRIGAVEDGTRAENDLDVVNELHGNTSAALVVGGPVPLLIHCMSVEQKQNVVAEVGGVFLGGFAGGEAVESRARAGG